MTASNPANAGACQAPDCETHARTKGLCDKHYNRMRRHGTLDLGPRTNAGKTCAEEHCDRPAFSRGFCTMHAARKYRHGTIELLPRVKYSKCATPGCRYKATEIGICRICMDNDAKAKAYAPEPSPQCIYEKCQQPTTENNYCTRHAAIQIRMQQRHQNDQERQTTIEEKHSANPVGHNPARYNMANHQEHQALGISHPVLQPTPAPWLTATWNLDHYTDPGAGPIPLTPGNLAILISIATDDLTELCRRRKALPHTVSWKVIKGPTPVLAATFQIKSNAHHIDAVRAAYRQAFPWKIDAG